MTTRAWVRLDDDDNTLSQYEKLALPRGWTLTVGPRLPLGAVYAEAYQRAADGLWWGFIADDVVPETDGWDRKLIEVAGDDGMAVPSGGHDAEGAPHFVLGGKLVDSIGWLVLPGLSRLYIDTVWADIAKARGVLRRVDDAVLRHHHFSNGLALRDETYRKPDRNQDRALYRAWKEDQ